MIEIGPQLFELLREVLGSLVFLVVFYGIGQFLEKWFDLK